MIEAGRKAAIIAAAWTGHGGRPAGAVLYPDRGTTPKVLRRWFLVAASALLASPLVARAQSARAAKPFRIGLLPDLDEAFTRMLKNAMGAAGWRERSDYIFVPSGVGYGETAAPGAKRLADQNVHLIMVASTAHAVAAHRASTRIPIVMWASGYPVEAGIAKSLAMPGKNVTGMTHYAGTGIWGKLLELLAELKPGIRRVGVAWGYIPPTFPREEVEPCYAELRSAARTLELSLHIEEISGPERIPAGLASIERTSPDALLITAGPGIWDGRQRVMAFAISKRLPTISDFPWPDADALRPLISYGGSFVAAMGQAAVYVVRILDDGAKPGELPIQQPSRFELAVDLRTARASQQAVPKSLLLRADRVID